MLVNVAISPNVILEISDSKLGKYAAMIQEQLSSILDKHGVLVQPSTQERQRLLELLKGDQLRPAEQKRWQLLLSQLNKSGRFTTATPSVIENWSDLTDGQQASSLQQLAPILSLVSEPDFSRLFPEDTNVHMINETVEITTAASLSKSRQFERLESLREDGTFPAGTHREDVWDTLFKPLTQVSKQITIFDRYLYNRLWERADPRGDTPEHLIWLLQHINEDIPSNGEVILIGEAGKHPKRSSDLPADPQRILDYLSESIRNQFDRIGAVELNVYSGREKMHHDRHIRFSTGHAFELPSGFDRFATLKLGDSVSFSYRYSSNSINELVRRESAARKAPLTRTSKVGR